MSCCTHARRRVRTFFRILSLGLAGVVAVSAQTPLTQGSAANKGLETSVLLDWKESAADSALRAGLASLAEDLYAGILESEGIEVGRAARVRLQMAAALINMREFERAIEVLNTIGKAFRSDSYDLHLAVAMYGDGRWVDQAAVRKALDRVDVNRLVDNEKSWYHLLDAFIAKLEGRAERVQETLGQALDAAVNDQQRYFIESIILREEIIQRQASDPLLMELGARLELVKGKASAYPFVREYAIVLYNLGREREAIAAIDRELADGSIYSIRQREQLLLLKGLFLGPATVSGRDALRELVGNGQDLETMGIALQLLARNSKDSEGITGFMRFLDRMIGRTEPHPLLGEMYYLKAQFAIAAGDYAAAEENARLLLDRFPGLQRIGDVYRMLAFGALQRDPPQYRTAADFLIQLREGLEAPSERSRLAVLIGDCYFLNKDYASAADFYLAARNESFVDVQEALFLRLISAETRSGRIEDALRHIDESDFRLASDVTSRWKAEWNLALALQSTGELEKALERVRGLLQDTGDETVPTALDIRLRWLEAHLSLSAAETDGILDRVESLLARIDNLPDGVLSSEDVRLLKTELLLLRAEVMIRTGQGEAGLAGLKALRAGYAESSAAERSYLTEASYLGNAGNTTEAQQVLVALAQRYPDGRFAAQALLEAALYAERRGPEHYDEAVVLLNRISKDFPGDPLVFSARLKQGDLMRLMNDFAGAQIVYESLVSEFPDHPQRYLAELSRADCMLALARDSDRELEDVALVLDQLLDLPNLPVDFQVEVGYKWAFALLQRDAISEAKQVLGLMAARYVLEGDEYLRFGIAGQYWISRILLELGALMENEGEIEAARRVYRKIVAYNMPGSRLAQSRADSLQAGNGAANANR